MIGTAGVSRKTFYELFDSKEDCFLAAYDILLGRLLDDAEAAFALQPGAPWPERIETGLRAVLDTGLLAPGGVICVDNTLLKGEPYLEAETPSPNGAAIAAFNQAVADDPRVEQVMLPLRDGLTLIRRA